MSAFTRKEKLIALLDRCEYQRKTIAGLTYENQRLNEEIKDARAYTDRLAAGLPEGMLPKDMETLREANAKLAQENHDLREANRWIPCTERLPEKTYEDIGDEVLVKLDYPFSRVAAVKFRMDDGKPDFYTGGWGNIMVHWTNRVTHWRLLPAGPEVEG